MIGRRHSLYRNPCRRVDETRRTHRRKIRNKRNVFTHQRVSRESSDFDIIGRTSKGYLCKYSSCVYKLTYYVYWRRNFSNDPTGNQRTKEQRAPRAHVCRFDVLMYTYTYTHVGGNLNTLLRYKIVIKLIAFLILANNYYQTRSVWSKVFVFQFPKENLYIVGTVYIWRW